jgi:hypothetical protein
VSQFSFMHVPCCGKPVLSNCVSGPSDLDVDVESFVVGEPALDDTQTSRLTNSVYSI